jgi:hypothetical protein
VKRILVSLATAGALFISACGFFGNTGEVREHQSRKTIFKSADEGQIDNPSMTPTPQKVPGE